MAAHQIRLLETKSTIYWRQHLFYYLFLWALNVSRDKCSHDRSLPSCPKFKGFNRSLIVNSREGWSLDFVVLIGWLDAQVGLLLNLLLNQAMLTTHIKSSTFWPLDYKIWTTSSSFHIKMLPKKLQPCKLPSAAEQILNSHHLLKYWERYLFGPHVTKCGTTAIGSAPCH